MTEEMKALFERIARGDAAGLAAALEAGADATARDRFGMSLLYHAAARGSLEMVEALLAAGAEVDRSSDSANTPLMAAAANGHLAVIGRLLAAGADPAHRNTWGLTAQDWGKWAPEPDTVRAHLAQGARAD